MADARYPFTAGPLGVRLAIRLTPGAHRNALDGIATGPDGGPVLRLRVRAPPVEGAANTALIKFLAETLGLREADVNIRSGRTARLKILHLSGDSPQILERLADWVEQRKTQARPRS